jgi:hypothetical protein
MAFRLIVSETPDITTIGVVGRLGDAAVVILGEACSGAGRPLVLDLSDLTSASDAGVLQLRRLAGEGVHLLGASRYMRLLLDLVPGESSVTSSGPLQRARRHPGAKPS